MGTLTLELPKDVEKIMKEFNLDWSEVAVHAISDKVEQLKKLKQFSSNVSVDDKTAQEFTDKVSKNVAKRFEAA